VGVSAHGVLRGARRSRIAFAVRATRGQTRAHFLYVDRASGVVLRALNLRSLAIDGRRGIATLRGTCVQASRRRAVTVVLGSHAGRRSLRIHISSGYSKSGGLLSGSITFIARPARTASIVLPALPPWDLTTRAWQGLDW
jgi:hypothetical protein